MQNILRLPNLYLATIARIFAKARNYVQKPFFRLSLYLIVQTLFYASLDPFVVSDNKAENVKKSGLENLTVCDICFGVDS